MLAFLIPLVSRSFSKSWDLTTLLLQNTLRSIFNQTNQSYVIIIVGHDKPDLKASFPQVEFVQVDFALELSSPDIPEVCPLGSEVKWADKGRKLLRAYLAAQKYRPTHVMLVDQDDLVSRGLAQLCAEQPTCNGWFIEKGYRYELGSKWIYKKRKNFHLECGTSFIFRNDLVPVPSPPEYDRESRFYSFFINHGYHVTRMLNWGNPLQKVPYPAAVAVMHGTNWSASENCSRNRLQDRLLRPLKLAANLRPLKSPIREEFGMD